MKASLVLKAGKNSEEHLKDFYSALYAEDEVFYGNIFSTTFSCGLNTDIEKKENVFALSGSILELPMPMKRSTIVSCFEGVLTQDCRDTIEAMDYLKADSRHRAFDAFYPCALLAGLNSKKSAQVPDEVNYVDLIKAKVSDCLEGSYIFTMLYITTSGKNKIIIGQRHRDIYFHIVYCNSFTILVWTDELDVFNALDKKFFIYSITPMYDKNVLVLHPSFLVTKWKKWWRKSKAENPLLANTAMESYLERTSR